ncbi:hypothetical protein [Stigmatella aurantiaca]|uniref:Uncharacterized protein n=1 Tax=Stigmatella aurantiaca (strain DW4/3-1) TaxID=378806 RepID=E3FL51_STIAD|nr:hypothetical protein [Stigmatella aurantiaca]ADO71759.1 uncharacterized protein STAUR_3971 [Stigmatella aurantiaca DW4/3-1]
MVSLSDVFSRIPDAPGPARSEGEYRLVEALTFSSSKNIVEFLEEVNGRDFTALPVWIRNLAFRLACLQEPDNPVLLRKSAADLECFGPDWDDKVAELRQRAQTLSQ